MYVTTLVENTRLSERQNLKNAWGMSLHISYKGKNILFDLGPKDEFLLNAGRLGVSIEEVDLLVLSHNHSDHVGGLSDFLSRNQKAPVMLSRFEHSDPYINLLGFFNKFIGMRKDLLREYKHRFDDISTATEVLEDVFILHTDEETYPEPRGNRRLLDKKNGTFKPDDFDHEVILVIKESDGLTVFTGCSHKGILNMIDTVGKRFPGRPIKAVFGGFHLVDLPIIQNLAESRPEIEAIGAQMLDRVAGRVYTGHCTGKKAYPILERVMGERLGYFSTGFSVEV